MTGYDGPIVDVDVHHLWRDDREITERLPRQWRDYLQASGKALVPSVYSGAVGFNGGRLIESYEPGGSRGTDPEILRARLLDRFGYYRCVLTHDVGQYGGHLNPFLSAALCRAVNDWNLETWLGGDERLYSVIVVPSGAPVEAAQEIRRVGGHPRLVSVCLAGNVLGRPFGDPVYDPIYEAASELGLHVALHYGNLDRPGTATTLAGGPPASGIARHSQFSQQAMHYISSYIVHGTFEKFPDLKLLVKEYGVGWLPYLMLRLDQAYPLLRAESPWVRRLPSDYIRRHVKLSTQPLDDSPDPRGLARLLESVDGIDDLLCFSTDWPHWTADDPSYVARRLPKSWHRKIFCTNACDFFGWPAPAAKTEPAAAG
jgi:predicted TIM-barrel fold metal-dependent hydrolase